MKFYQVRQIHAYAKSPPARGAWIEIVFLRAGRADRESPPARGAWIEMLLGEGCKYVEAVAPRTGGVD